MIANEKNAQEPRAIDEIEKSQLHQKQLEFLVANIRVSLSASIFNASIFCAFVYPYIPLRDLSLWYGAMCVSAVPRLCLLYLFYKDRSRFSLGQWTWFMVAGTFVSGLIWGASGPLFFAQLPPLGQAFQILLIGGTLTGAAIYLSQLFPSFVSFAIPHVAPMLFILFSRSGDGFHVGMAVLLCIFTAMMFLMAIKNNRQFTALTLFQLRNDALIAKLNESEYLFRTLTEHVTAGVVLVCNERLLYLNPAAEAITGYSFDDLKDTTLWDLVDEEHREIVRSRARLRLKNPAHHLAPARYEFKIRNKQGIARWVDYTPAVVDYRGEKAILGAFWDITDRVLAQQERQESEERYRLLFETANDAIYVVGLQDDGSPGLFRDANPLGSARLGYTREEILDRGPQDITHLYDLKYTAGLHRRLLQEGRAVFEVSHVTKDGRFLPVEVSAKIITHLGQRAMLCIVRDISERKESELKLQAAKKQAETANQAKSEFLASMSHEIRTPLNGLLGMLQLVRLGDLDPEREQYLDVAMNSGASLLAIINDILDLSKIEAGKFELAPISFDLPAMIESVNDTFQFSAQSKGVRLFSVIDETIPRVVLADQARLRQILYNLVGNAVKFTHVGEIRVGLSMLSRTGNAGMLEIYVSDTGIGIAKEQQSGLFEPFVQAGPASSAKASGTGLGLSIVKRIVGFMGGDVRLLSELGRGTTIIVRAEVAIPEQPDNDVTPCIASRSCCPVAKAGLRVLVAEDNVVNQLMVMKSLEKLGHHGVCVQDGEEALERLRRETFDCVLMDIQMPGLDGTEVTRLIRNRALPEIDPNIPIIALTAYALSGDRERFLNEGMTGYLSKPVSIADLAAILSEVVRDSDGNLANPGTTSG